MRQTRHQTNWQLHLHMHCDTDYTAARSQVTTVCIKGIELSSIAIAVTESDHEEDAARSLFF